MKSRLLLSLSAAALLASGPATAGVFILDGTDADDHGSASGGVNLQGWRYIQLGLQNIASSPFLTNTNRSLVVLGADTGFDAANAIQSAFTASGLGTLPAGSNWTINFLNGTQISDFFGGIGSVTTSTASFIYIPTQDGDVGGGINGTEEAILTTNATAIDSFLGSGGGLFSHTHGYGWLSALIPTAQVVQSGATGLTLTPSGNSNFPGLTNADLSSGPWHNYFTNFGGIPVLATGITNGVQRAVVIGGAGGSITAPPPSSAVPEPSTWAMMLVGFGFVGRALRFRRQQTTVRFQAA